jgi:hypothetical protein
MSKHITLHGRDITLPEPELDDLLTIAGILDGGDDEPAARTLRQNIGRSIAIIVAGTRMPEAELKPLCGNFREIDIATKAILTNLGLRDDVGEAAPANAGA